MFLLNFREMITKKEGKVKVTTLNSESGDEAVNTNCVDLPFLHFSSKICILNAETIIKRMSRIKEKFSLVDEAHSTKFLKIRNQT